jgi:prepilin-type N-terminal cleavage/methylation domain-containing protein
VPCATAGPPADFPPLTRRGVTLVELVVALALVGTVLALVLPALSAPASRRGRLDAVLRAARGSAIARSQTLTLAVAPSGGWRVRALPPADTLPILDGVLDAPPSAGYELQLSPLGACFPARALPAEFGGWDAAACRPSRLAEPPE